MEPPQRSLDDLEAELKLVKAEIDALYWAFTRTARGKPPAVVKPELYARKKALEAAIAQWRRHLRTCCKTIRFGPLPYR